MLGAILRAPLDTEWKLCFGAFPNPDLTRVTTRGPAGAVRRVGRPAREWAEKLLRAIEKHYPQYVRNRHFLFDLAQDSKAWQLFLGGLTS